MKIFSQRKIINLMLFVALVIIGLSSSLAYLQIQRLIEANRWVTHTHKVIEGVDQTHYLISEAEAETVLYLVSRDKQNIKDLNAISNQITTVLNNLAVLTKDNVIQIANVKKLAAVVTDKMNLLSTIVEQPVVDNKTISDLFESPQNIALRKQIDALIDKISTQEKLLLDIRNNYSTVTAMRSNMALITAGIISEFLFLLSILLLNYYLRQKDKIELKQLKTQNELDEKNKKLEVTRERYNLAASGSKTGVWDWKVGTEDVYYSTVLKKMLGYQEDEFPNLLSSFKSHIHPEDVNRVLTLVDKHLKDKKVILNIEFRMRSRNGQYLWYRMVGKAIRSKDGKPLRMAGSLVDITSQKEVEIMKNEFVSTVSHELRTPLTSIHGAITLLTTDGIAQLSDEANQLLVIAQNNCERLIRLINDILDMEKIESGKIKFNYNILKLNEIVREAMLANQSYAGKYKVKLKLEKELPEISVYSDHDRLIQVLTNLISNAIKFSPTDEYVSLDVNLRGEKMVRVSVIDKGIGIPEEFQKQIFQKFSQEDSSSTRKKEGTGLGLNISKTIIERMGGSIGFETSKGKGTTFYIDIPTIDENTEIPTESTPTNQSAVKINSLNILHLEDDKDLAKIVKTILVNEANLVNVRTIQEAKTELENNNYDLAILDLKLPDGDSMDIIPLLHQKNVPIIIFTAYELPQEYISYVNTILTKSKASVSELVVAIRRIINSKKEREISGRKWQPRGHS